MVKCLQEDERDKDLLSFSASLIACCYLCGAFRCLGGVLFPRYQTLQVSQNHSCKPPNVVSFSSPGGTQLSKLRKGWTFRQTEASWSHLKCISLHCEDNHPSTFVFIQRYEIKWSAQTLHVHAVRSEAESFHCHMCGEGLLEDLLANLHSSCVSVASSDQNGPPSCLVLTSTGVFEVYRGPQQDPLTTGKVCARPRVPPS